MTDKLDKAREDLSRGFILSDVRFQQQLIDNIEALIDAKLSHDTASAAGGGTEANYTRSWITNCHIVEREPGDVTRLRLDRYTIVPTELAPTAYRDASRMRADTASAAGGGEPRGCPTPGACSCLPVQPAPAAEGGEDEETARLAANEADVSSWGMDASKWAAAFRQTAMSLGYSDMDEGWLIGWFANAIERSADQHPRVRTATARIRELEAERDRGRDILADTDIASLPRDHTLELTARARMNQLRAAEASLAALREDMGKVEEALEALKTVNKIVSEAALTGFRYDTGDWAERLFASQWGTSQAIAALSQLRSPNDG